MDLTTSKDRLLQELRRMGIDDERVLDALARVRREDFVPSRLYREAYRNMPLPIGDGQTISQPYVVAYMTQVLELKPEDRVLEIGTGCGYQAAVLGELVEHVYSVEIIEPLGLAARDRLERLGYRNVSVRIGDGNLGWPEEAPFDAIIVTAAPATMPLLLPDQLGEAGRMIVPVGRFHQDLILLKKQEGEITTTRLIPVAFVPMTGKAHSESEQTR